MICISFALTSAHVSYMTLSRMYHFLFVEITVTTEYLKSRPKYTLSSLY